MNNNNNNNNNKYENNHFLQKALAKNFAINGKIKWKRYKTNEGGVFNIKTTPNSKQPISIKKFYSLEIEKGMNRLESDGIKIIRKIALFGNANPEVELSRKEETTLKFYLLLSSVRTNQLRNNIKDFTGDSTFNQIMKNDGRTPQEIQEEAISIIIEKYHEVIKEGWIKCYYDFLEILKKKNSNNVKMHILKLVLELKNARLVFFKFPKLKLFLQETLSFVEFGSNLRIMFSFSPITPNMGVLLYYDAWNQHYSKQDKSKIFKNDFCSIGHRVEYKNHKILFEKQKKFILSKRPKTTDEKMKYVKIFLKQESHKYIDMNDKFIYEILEENDNIADVCNAMALVHNKNSIFIYQNEEDIVAAEKEIIRKGIFRIEDHL